MKYTSHDALPPLKADCYTVAAVIEAGVHPTIARTLVADGPRAVPQRARTTVYGRGRTPEPILGYVWGPDALAILSERRPSDR